MGAGIRAETFHLNFLTGSDKTPNLGTYLKAEINQIVQNSKQWHFQANGLFYTSGNAAGNFYLNGAITKKISEQLGNLKIAFTEQLTGASYNQTVYANQFFHENFNTALKSNSTLLSGVYNLPQYHFSVTVNYSILSNYFYLADTFFRVTNGHLLVQQYAPTFNLMQLNVGKMWQIKYWKIDNQMALQQTESQAPLHVPLLMLKSQISFEKNLFNNKLKVATGLIFHYYTAFQMDAYSALYNRYYVQNSYTSNHQYDVGTFFNLK